MCEVVHYQKDKYDVYIGRPSKWGNPYSHKDDTIAEFKVDTVDEAIKKYEEYLLNNHELMKSLPELKYKKIACWCITKKCHGYILKKYVDRLEDLDKRNNFFNE